MEKTVLLPTWRESPATELDEPNSSYATVTDHGTHRRVVFSGALAVEGELGEQVRTIFDRRREALQDLGGSMADVVITRYYVDADTLSREAQAEIHAARDDFFDAPDYPASTMVGVDSLLAEEALVEIEIEAEIPSESWERTVLTETDL